MKKLLLSGLALLVAYASIACAPPKYATPPTPTKITLNLSPTATTNSQIEYIVYIVGEETGQAESLRSIFNKCCSELAPKENQDAAYSVFKNNVIIYSPKLPESLEKLPLGAKVYIRVPLLSSTYHEQWQKQGKPTIYVSLEQILTPSPVQRAQNLP